MSGEILKQLHDSVKARANANESLSEPIPGDNDVKQGDIPAPTLAVMLSYAFQDCDTGYTFALEPLAKSSTFVVSTSSRKFFSLLSENSCSQMMQILLPIRKKAFS